MARRRSSPMSRRRPSISIRQAASARSRRRKRWAQAARDHSGRSVRPAGRSRCASRRSPRRTACSCSTTRRRLSARPIAAASSARWRPRPRPAFFRPSRSAATATAARSSPTTTRLAARVKSLRLHGEGADRSEAVRIGITGRLDTIQAAVLIEKLKIFPDEIAARNRVAARYSRGARRRRDGAARRQRIDFGVGAIHDPRSRRAAATRLPPR